MLLRRIKAMLERRTGLPFIGRQRPKLAPLKFNSLIVSPLSNLLIWPLLLQISRFKPRAGFRWRAGIHAVDNLPIGADLRQSQCVEAAAG